MVHKADLLTLIGRCDQALDTIRALNHREQYPVHFDGIFLRWHARAASSAEESDFVAEQLMAAAGRLECYPTLDRAEILMGLEYLETADGSCQAARRQTLGALLERLPGAVADHFRALAFLRP